MNSRHPSLARLFAAVTLLTATTSLAFARGTAVPEIAVTEVAQALDRLSTENEKRVHLAIDASVAALRAGTADIVAAVVPAKSQPTASVEVLLPRGNRSARRTIFHG